MSQTFNSDSLQHLTFWFFSPDAVLVWPTRSGKEDWPPRCGRIRGNYIQEGMLSDFLVIWSKSKKRGVKFTSLPSSSTFCLGQTTSSALKGAIQLGIGYTVGNLSSKPERDVLMQDFYVVESIFFPRSVVQPSVLCQKNNQNKAKYTLRLIFFLP